MVDKVSKIYAVAIFEIAIEEDKILSILELLDGMKELYETNIEFKEFMKNPLIKKEQKLDMIKKICSEAKDIEQEIMLYLVRKNRLDEISNIAYEYRELYYSKENIVGIKGIFSMELSVEQKAKLIEKLEKITNKKINFEQEIDPKLIGGGILKIGDKILDGSIRTQLAQMAKGE
jgi:F-type H+-transporting ATPase subunit delta